MQLVVVLVTLTVIGTPGGAEAGATEICNPAGAQFEMDTVGQNRRRVVKSGSHTRTSNA